MYSCGPPHMDEQRQDVQLGPTYNSSVPILDVALKTYRERWTIEKGGGRGSMRSVMMARHDDETDQKKLESFNLVYRSLFFNGFYRLKMNSLRYPLDFS